MRLFRSLFAALIAYCVASAPFAIIVAAPLKAAPATAAVETHANAGMPDCHGMKSAMKSALKSAAVEAPATAGKSAHENSSHKHCPDCDKGVCAGDLCALKCFKVFAELPGAPQLAIHSGERYAAAGPSWHKPTSIEPQPPPPRA